MSIYGENDVTTYMHAQKLPPSLATCVPVNSAPNVLYSVAHFSHYYIFGATWPVTSVSEVDDAMTEDSSVNMDSAYTKVVRYCSRPPRKFTAKRDWELSGLCDLKKSYYTISLHRVYFVSCKEQL